MLRVRIYVVLIVVLVLVGVAPLPAQTVPPKSDEGKLIAVLTSDAPRKEKADACRQLAIIGTKDAIAPLARLLGDEELSHMARYALEPIPDPAVDQAFRDALGKLKGGPLVGVIGSIGVRRDAEAVPALSKLLHDPQAAQAASRALGSIGNVEAAKALTRALLADSTDANALARYEGLLRCAEKLGAEGQRDEAVGIYDHLRGLPAPHQVRAGALRGAILARRGAGRVALLREHLRSDDYVLFSAACQTALDLPEPEVTQVLVAELMHLPADNQILAIWTLGKRGDAAALPTLFDASKGGPLPVRLAAMKTLPEIGNASAILVLVDLMADSNAQISQTALECLASLPGPEADNAVMTMFRSSNTATRLAALDLMGRRRMTQAASLLARAAADAEGELRPAAIKKVGELGGPDQLPVLLDLLMRSKTAQDLDATRQALSDICAKIDDPRSAGDELIRRLGQSQPEQKMVLLRVLGATGGPNALRAVRKAVSDANPDVHVAAIRVLGTWKTADAVPDLLALTKSAANPNDRMLCLRGYLGFAARRDMPAERRLSMCREAVGLVRRDDEKRLLLGTLGGIDSPEAISLIAPFLDDPATGQEAGMALTTIADKLLKEPDAGKHAPSLVEPLEKLARTTTNADLARRADSLLRQAKHR